MNKSKFTKNNTLKLSSKTTVKSGKKIVEIYPQSIDQALQDLESGNLTAVKNFIRSLQGKQYKASKGTREILEEYSKELKIKATPAEKEFKNLLKELKIKFVFQKPITYKKGVSYIMDFYLPLDKICIEIDGGYHDTPEQIAKDIIRTKHLTEMHIKVLRIKNDEVFDKNFAVEFINGMLDIPI